MFTEIKQTKLQNSCDKIHAAKFMLQVRLGKYTLKKIYSYILNSIAVIIYFLPARNDPPSLLWKFSENSSTFGKASVPKKYLSLTSTYDMTQGVKYDDDG